MFLCIHVTLCVCACVLVFGSVFLVVFMSVYVSESVFFVQLCESAVFCLYV